MTLKICPHRLENQEFVLTGILVRAQKANGVFGNFDLAELDRESLIEWLREAGEKYDAKLTKAQRTVLIILNHPLPAEPYES